MYRSHRHVVLVLYTILMALKINIPPSKSLHPAQYKQQIPYINSSISFFIYLTQVLGELARRSRDHLSTLPLVQSEAVQYGSIQFDKKKVKDFS